MKPRVLCFTLFLILVGAIILPDSVFACSCGRIPTLLESFDSAELVIAVKLVALNKRGTEPNAAIESATMIVDKVYKGKVKVGDELKFAQGGGGDCIFTYSEDSIGSEYLFYLGEPRDRHPFDLESNSKSEKHYYPITCGRSNSLRGAAADLLYLDNMEEKRGKTRISGTIGSFGLSGIPGPEASGREVRLTGNGRTWKLKTDRNGVYQKYDLPPGRYVLEMEIPRGWKPGYVDFQSSKGVLFDPEQESKSGIFQAPFIIYEKGHTSIDVWFDVDTSLKGKVLSPEGAPMKNVCVEVISAEEDKPLPKYTYLFDCTNEEGGFEIDEIPPGQFLLIVNKDGKVSSDEPFGTLFYPGVTERRDAVPITVDLGNYLEGLIIRIPSTAERVTITGRLLYSDDKPVEGERVEFEPSTNEEGFEGEAGTQTGPDGSFRFTVLRRLKGKIFGSMYTYSGEFKDCPALEKMIKESASGVPKIKTPQLEVTAEKDISGLVFRFPFPRCEKAKKDYEE